MLQPEPGMTLLLPSGPANDPRKNHLFVLMTAASGPARQVLMVPICTLRATSDRTCILQADDHEFLQRESFVAYRNTRLEFADRLVRGVAKGELTERDRIDGAILTEIRKGFERSRFVGRFAPAFLDQYGY